MARPDGRASARKSFVFLAVGMVIFFFASVSSADVPDSINYQGKLTTASGGCLNDTVQMTFTIYADELGISDEWSETQTQVEVKEGIFNVLLGSVNPLAASIFDGTAKYLGVQVESDPEMSPLKPMVTTAYAFRSQEADTAEYARAAPAMPDDDWVIDGDNIYRELGNVGIGTTTPAEKLDVVGNMHASGTITSGSSITIDGATDKITASSGTIDFDNENIVTTGKATIGPGHTNTGVYAFVAGQNNTATGNNPTVSGGLDNVASNDRSTVGGGVSDTASGIYSTVAGGAINMASGQHSTVGGGNVNLASGNYSTVSGGGYDTASGTGSCVGGGGYNVASGEYTAVGGGFYNRARGQYSVVSGGGGPTDADSNSALGNYSAIGGGIQNTASASWSTVGGGGSNTASGDESTISGGYINTASGGKSVVGGGYANTASGSFSIVSGGRSNTASDDYSTVGGGRNNRARGEYSVVSGGGGSSSADSNSAIGDWSSIVGGKRNIASGELAAVAGGGSNSASGVRSAIGGGTSNNASNEEATVGGGQGNNASGVEATVSGGYTNTASGNQATIGGGSFNKARGLLSVVAGGGGTAGNEADSNSALGNYSVVPGGTRNIAGGNYSFAAGRRAKANHNGTFVWADQTNADFASGGNDQFLIRASGGVGIGTNSPSQALEVAGTIYSTSGGFKFPDGTVQATAASPGARYDSGWFAVVKGGTYTKVHNLGSTALIIQVWFSTTSDGTGNVFNATFVSDISNYGQIGASVQDLTTTDVTIQAGYKAVAFKLDTNGQNPNNTTYRPEAGYYRIIAIRAM